MLRRRLIVGLSIAWMLAGCGPDATDSGDDEVRRRRDAGAHIDLGEVCAQHHAGTTSDGEPVEVCEQLYPSRPFVRLPADAQPASGPSVLYGSFELLGNFALVTRDGTTYTVVDSHNRPLAVTSRGLPAGLRLPSNRGMYTVYRVTGTTGTVHSDTFQADVPSIQMSDATPVAVLTGRAIDGQFLRSDAADAPSWAWEGTVSRRTGDRQWSWTETVPIRISFDRIEPRENLKVWGDPNRTLPDGPTFTLHGVVENLSRAVRASDGSCMPALDSYGDANPYLGATDPAIVMYRLAAMHFPGDQVIVMTYPSGLGPSLNGMDNLQLLHPIGLMQVDPSAEWSSMTIRPHGTPNGHSLTLQPVTGGGGDC